MNVERLCESVRRILAVEEELSLQEQLQALRDDVNQVTQSPSDPSLQAAMVQQLQAVLQLAAETREKLTRGDFSTLQALGGDHFFDTRVVETVKGSIQANAMTPVVVRDEVHAFANQRRDFVERLRTLVDVCSNLGIRGESIPPGTAELSVLLPRTLFRNELRELAAELATLTSIVKPFSEVATGQVGPITVNDISTSDPTFLLSLDVETLKAITDAIIAVTGLINALLPLRKGKEQSQINNAPPEFIEWHDEQMKKQITNGIDAHVKQLLEQSNATRERQHELNLELTRAMTMMADRLQRGVQITVLVSAEAGPAEEKQATFATLKELSAKVEPPQLEGNPPLALTDGAEDPQKPGVMPQT